jgi:hypothetical protein
MFRHVVQRFEQFSPLQESLPAVKNFGKSVGVLYQLRYAVRLQCYIWMQRPRKLVTTFQNYVDWTYESDSGNWMTLIVFSTINVGVVFCLAAFFHPCPAEEKEMGVRRGGVRICVHDAGIAALAGCTLAGSDTRCGRVRPGTGMPVGLFGDEPCRLVSADGGLGCGPSRECR